MAQLKAAGILAASVERKPGQLPQPLDRARPSRIKGLLTPGMGFFSLETAGRTVQGEEGRNLLGKGQASRVGKGDLGGQGTFIAGLFAVAASVQQEGGNLLAFGSCAFLQHNQSNELASRRECNLL
jgi:hypothetical protein